jgi:hypothetical protein
LRRTAMTSTSRIVAWTCGILFAGLVALTGVGLVVWLIITLGHRSQSATTENISTSSAGDGHYALAEVEPVNVGGATVSIKHWSIRRVPGIVGDQHKESPEEFLIVNLHVSTEDPDRTFEFKSWHKPREANEDGFRAVDNFGNHYERVKFPSEFHVKWQSDRELVSVHEPTMDRIVIEKPRREAKEIRITLPSRNVTGVDGPDIRFLIELKRSFKDEHGSHEFDPRNLPTDAEVRREAEKAERDKRETEKEVHREAEKAESERAAKEQEERCRAEKAHEEELRRQADKEAEEIAARHAEREAQRKRDADAAAVRAQMEEKVKEKERQREEERRVSERLDREEKYAAELLHLAKQFIDTDKPDKEMAAKKLTEIIDKYPNTQAAKEAKKLRAGL